MSTSEKGVLIHTIVTRFNAPPEVGCFLGLIYFSEWTRRQLGISRRKVLNVEFVSASDMAEVTRLDQSKVLPVSQLREVEAHQGKIYYDVGGGQFDHHGLAENENGVKICSLDLLQARHDFTQGLPKLTAVIERVKSNDRNARRIGRNPFNLRAVTMIVNRLTQGEPQEAQREALEWQALAFCGVFQQVQNGHPINKTVRDERANKGRRTVNIFDPRPIKEGVKLFLDREVKAERITAQEARQRHAWFTDLMDKAVAALKQAQADAETAVKMAAANFQTRSVNVPWQSDPTKVILVLGNNRLLGPTSRHAGYGVLIQINVDEHGQPNGHFQIQTDFIYDGQNQPHRIWLDEIARALRIRESQLAHRGIDPSANWANDASVFFKDGEQVPGHLPRYRSGYLVGGESSPDAPKSLIPAAEVLEIVVENLPKCKIVLDERPELIKPKQTNRPAEADEQPTADRVEIQVGDVITGTVKNIVGYGAFIEVAPGRQGLVHISELTHQWVKSVETVLQVGQTVTVKVIRIEGNRIDLSRKAVLTQEAEEATSPDAIRADDGLPEEKLAAGGVN